ncbi:MAG: MerR family transcriptional regulator [Deltaproteobacteria bacterium]|nr:MerR family transcriptional regulator [Deltaproteobacteria bacterium]
MRDEQLHPIQVVAHRTGLSQHVIRMWEKRYEAVTPKRTATNRRLYSEADIERLRLLHRAIRSGRRIGHATQLSTRKLAAVVAADEQGAATAPVARGARLTAATCHAHVETCLCAVEELAPVALEEALHRATVALSQPVMLEQVVVPLIYEIGARWHDGSLRIANEHMASAVIREFFTTLRGRTDPSSRAGHAPHLIVATPTGQLHGLGADLVTAVAVAEGWRVTALGVNLPVAEIAGAVHQQPARAVALSLVYPADDLALNNELRTLRRQLPAPVALLVGGRAAPGYREVLTEIDAMLVPDLSSLRIALGVLSSPDHTPSGRGE